MSGAYVNGSGGVGLGVRSFLLCRLSDLYHGTVVLNRDAAKWELGKEELMLMEPLSKKWRIERPPDGDRSKVAGAEA